MKPSLTPDSELSFTHSGYQEHVPFYSVYWIIEIKIVCKHHIYFKYSTFILILNPSIKYMLCYVYIDKKLLWSIPCRKKCLDAKSFGWYRIFLLVQPTHCVEMCILQPNMEEIVSSIHRYFCGWEIYIVFSSYSHWDRPKKRWWT